MADVDALAAAHLASPSPSTLAAVADLVTAGGHEALQQLVGALGPQLTGTDERERSQATLLLADVLSRIPLAALPADSVAHLTDFFCNRLTDYPCVAAVLRGLLALLQAPLRAEHALRIATMLLEECDVRSLVQAERHAAIRLANELLRLHWPSLAVGRPGARTLDWQIIGCSSGVWAPHRDSRTAAACSSRRCAASTARRTRATCCSSCSCSARCACGAPRPLRRASMWRRRRSSTRWRSTSPSRSRRRPTTRTASPSSICCRRCRPP
jgi:hypothetical protein